MKKTRTPRTHTRNHTKRHGKHHKHSRNYIKAYAPYLPLFVSIVASLFLSFWQPNPGNTLAYATNTSVSGLLTSTNSQRSAHGKSSLKINAKLNGSAQAKAQDMVTKNYWSHNTPSGQEPWVFITNAGYDYTKAGENLAYGFATSTDTIAGWMNSPTHKANMLDGSFTEVGFGIANSSNFNGDGKQTIVVAHYARPQVLAATQSPAQTPATQTTPVQRTQAPAPQPSTPATSKKETAKKESKEPATPAPITTEQPVAQTVAVSQNVAKVETLTDGRAPWLLGFVTFLTGAAVITKLLHHSLKARHLLHDLIKDTERFVLHHPLLDSTLLGIAILGATLLRTAGTIL